MKRLKKALIVLLGGNITQVLIDKETIKGFMDDYKAILESAFNSKEKAMHELVLFDFQNPLNELNLTPPNVEPRVLGSNPMFVQQLEDANIEGINEVKVLQIALKPVEVVEELETMPLPFNLDFLDEKIELLKQKSKLISQVHSKREVDAMIERLENRKKYNEHKNFFERFKNTDQVAIDKLLVKHTNLKLGSDDLFVPELPIDAIATMTEYTKHVEAICNKKPVFNIIAEHKDFVKSEKRRDPILLAQSPFGFYYQILGAWDKEMVLLTEL